MKSISWNVNGTSCLCRKRALWIFFRRRMQIFSAFRRRKMQEGQLELDTPGYHQYWNYAKKKGYSGTAIFTKRRTNQSVSLRTWNRGARPGRTCDHSGI